MLYGSGDTYRYVQVRTNGTTGLSHVLMMRSPIHIRNRARTGDLAPATFHRGTAAPDGDAQRWLRTRRSALRKWIRDPLAERCARGSVRQGEAHVSTTLVRFSLLPSGEGAPKGRPLSAIRGLRGTRAPAHRMRVRYWRSASPNPNPHPALRATFSRWEKGREKMRTEICQSQTIWNQKTCS